MKTLTYIFVFISLSTTAFAKVEFFQIDKLLDLDRSAALEREVHGILGAWAHYIDEHCSNWPKTDLVVCTFPNAFKTYTETSEFLAKDRSAFPPGHHTPDGMNWSDYRAMNWFSDAFSTESHHEATIRSIFLTELSREVMLRSLDAMVTRMDRFKGAGTKTYKQIQSPIVKSFLTYTHPFLRAYMYVHLSECPESAINPKCKLEKQDVTSKLYSTLHAKRPVIDAILNAFTNVSEFPLPELTYLRQVYNLNKILNNLKSTGTIEVVQLFNNPESADSIIPELDQYVRDVRELTVRSTNLSDVERIQMYRSAVWVDDWSNLISDLPMSESDILTCEFGVTDAYCDFAETLDSIGRFFTGVEDELLK